jgi:signal-transduction protein with cAMP-binding, CBS, and nucleotidyltransferase domain
MLASFLVSSPETARASNLEEIMACIQNRVIQDVIAVTESVSCAEAARVMAQFGIGCVGVRRGDKLLGIVTSRELLGCLTGVIDAHRTPIGSALRPDMPTVSSQASDQECARLMRCYRTGHLAVEENGEIVGVITLLNLCDLVVEDREWNIKLLQSRLPGGRHQQLAQPITTIFNPRPRARGFMAVGAD